jgi:hypothetical protein
MKRASSTGIALLGIWLILTGLAHPPINLSFSGFALLQGILALVAGILILIGR